MQSFSPLPAWAQKLFIGCGSRTATPATSRPSDWKQYCTQPGSLFRHQSEVFFQLPPTHGRLGDGASRSQESVACPAPRACWLCRGRSRFFVLGHCEVSPKEELWFSMKAPPLHMTESVSVCSL